MHYLAQAADAAVKVTKTFATTTPDGDRVVVTVPVTICPVGYPEGVLTWDGGDPQSDLRGARRNARSTTLCSDGCYRISR